MRATRYAAAALIIVNTLIAPLHANAQSTPLKIASDCHDDSIANDPSSSEGAIVKTLDGHIYQVDEVDRIDSELWLTADDVLVCWARYRYQGHVVTLYTLRDGDDKVDATRLR